MEHGIGLYTTTDHPQQHSLVQNCIYSVYKNKKSIFEVTNYYWTHLDIKTFLPSTWA